MTMRAWPIAVTLMLAGCSYMDRPQEVNESPPAVSYTVTNNNMGQANDRAASYCQRYGKRAVLGPITQSGTESVANYSCQ
jgi:hypothetical protein